MSTRFQAYLEQWTSHLGGTHPSTIILFLVLGIWIFIYWNRKTIPSNHDSPSGEKQEQGYGYGYPPINPLPTFNWETTNPLVLRPFKPKYHLTMGLSTIDISDLIPMDNTYKERMVLRKSLLKEYPDVVLGVHDAADPDPDPRIRDAVGELYEFIMGTYLPSRYPRMFALSHGDKSALLENKVTGETYPVAMDEKQPQPVLKCLEILGQTVDEDFLILLPDGRGKDSGSSGGEEKYFLAAYTTYFPSGFDPRTKLGLRLAAIHDPVPGYQEKLERSMDRFFARVEVGKVVARVNWSVTTETGLFAAFGGVHGETAPSTSGTGGEERAGSEKIEAGMLDVDSTVLRCERQTLHRLPRSKALVFAFHTYTYPLQTIKDEGLGEELATAIDGLKAGNVPGMHWYKRGSVWGEAVKHFLRS